MKSEPPRSETHALVPAAGSGERFGSKRPKVLIEIAGRPAICHAFDRLHQAGVNRFWVALPGDWIVGGRELIQASASNLSERIQVIAGGRYRQESVALLLEASRASYPDGGGEDPLLVVHDGARPAVDPDDVERTIEAARVHGAAILGRPVTDTIKRVKDRWVKSTVERAALFRAETPQVMKRSLLATALAAARKHGFLGTDESSLLEASQTPVWTVEARCPNPKLTYPGDLAQIESLLAPSVSESGSRAEERELSG